MQRYSALDSNTVLDQALTDPYCQSTVYVCVSLCAFVCKFDAKYLGN